MRRCLTVLAMVLTMLMGTLSAVSAQRSATPTTGGNAGAATVYGTDGQPESTIEVTRLADPFKDFDPSSPPQRGFHFIAAEVTVTAVGSQDVQVNTSGFFSVDADGFLSQPTYVYRSSDAQAAQPDFPTDPIPAGKSASGLVYFQVLDGTKPNLIVYQPDGQRLVTVADYRSKPVAQGDKVAVVANDGSPSLNVTVKDLTLPLTDFDPSSPPQRGFQFAGITVTIENVGTTSVDINPYSFNLVDKQGFIDPYYQVYRTSAAETASPSLQSATLDAGKSVTGLVGFQMLSGTEPAMIYFAPTSDREVRVAEYGSGTVAKPATTPKPLPTRPAPPAETPTASAGEVPTVAAGVTTPGCEGVVDWATATLANFNTLIAVYTDLAPVFSPGGKVDVATVKADEQKMSDLTDKQDRLDTPDVASDAQDKVVALFDDTDSALSDLADALDANNAAAVSQAVAKLTQIGTSLNDTNSDINVSINALTKKCPELNNVGS